mmetsp:Transcript_19558/g.45450  ORF Transcript_19558/g.45450 Transcript_19558/m.45450 type:complete len:491 (-) Transcript_19558:383-1855(-)
MQIQCVGSSLRCLALGLSLLSSSPPSSSNGRRRRRLRFLFSSQLSFPAPASQSGAAHPVWFGPARAQQGQGFQAQRLGSVLVELVPIVQGFVAQHQGIKVRTVLDGARRPVLVGDWYEPHPVLDPRREPVNKVPDSLHAFFQNRNVFRKGLVLEHGVHRYPDEELAAHRADRGNGQRQQLAMPVMHPVKGSGNRHLLEEAPRRNAGSADHAAKIVAVVVIVIVVVVVVVAVPVAIGARLTASFVLAAVVVQKHHVVAGLPVPRSALGPRIDVDGHHRRQVAVLSIRVDRSNVRVQSPGTHSLAELELLAPAHGRGGFPAADRIVANDRIEVLGNVLDPGFRGGIGQVLGIDYHVTEIAAIFVTVVLPNRSIVLVVGEGHRIPQGGVDLSGVPSELRQGRSVPVAVAGCLATQNDAEFSGVLNGPIQDRLVGNLVGGGVRHAQNRQRVLVLLFSVFAPFRVVAAAAAAAVVVVAFGGCAVACQQPRSAANR